MQTVLYTRILKRVVAQIRRKELALWPADRAGRDDAVRYIAALGEARDRILGSPGGRGRRTMLIEFILSGDASLVAIAEPRLEEADGHVRVVSKRPIAVLDLSRRYVRGDIYEIAQDALGLAKREAREVLVPLLPPDTAADAGTPPGEERRGDGR